MGELVHLGPQQPQEPEAGQQSAAAETGPTTTEQESTLERGDIDALQQKASELHGMNDVQRGLEGSIIGAGLQVMVDRYGADRFLDAIQGYDEEGQQAGNLQEVIRRLAPEESEQDNLYKAIKAEPMDALAERFDETLGGVADGNTSVSAMERFRRHEMFSIENRRVMKDADGKRAIRERDTGGATDSSYLLLTGDFDKLLENHPELVEKFREKGDTLTLLKGIRGIYQAEYDQFSADLERAKATVEEKIADGEAGVADLQAFSDDIFGEEISNLQERLDEVSSDAKREMVQNMLDKKAVEALDARDDFKSKMDAVRSKIIDDLGADRLDQLQVAAPAEAKSSYNDKEKDAA